MATKVDQRVVSLTQVQGVEDVAIRFLKGSGDKIEVVEGWQED